MKASELRQKSKGELADILGQKQERLAEVRRMAHQKKIKNVREIPAVKRDIARVLTLMRQI